MKDNQGLIIKRLDTGLFTLEANKDGEYKDHCLCHRCKKSKDLAPLEICPIMFWAVSSEHKVIVTVAECKSFK
jgi:hypothetical protein